ncbi:hypothetical protein ABK040_007224 [Willaertia magna]
MQQKKELEVFTHPMSSEGFRKHAHQTVDFIIDYYENVLQNKDGNHPVGETISVCSKVEPGYLNKLLPNNAPEKGESFEEIIKDVKEKILPGVTHWQHPNFFAFFSANFSYPALLGDMFSGMFNVVGFNWQTSPACTELETIVMDWLAKAMHLPKCFLSETNGGGVIQDTASSAAIVVMLAAKERKRAELIQNQDQFNMPEFLGKLVAYTSEHAHSSIQKACMVTGVLNFRKIKAKKDTFEMDYKDLEENIKMDLEKGYIPFFVCATIGTTSSTAIDPIGDIGPICDKYKLFLHVDSAFLGSTLLLPECRVAFTGSEECENLKYCDSFTFNPHKWMLTSFDCSALWVKERKNLKNALSIDPEYLRNKASQSGLVTDYRDWQLPLGRRFRSLKLWFVLRVYGIEGLQRFLRYHIELAEYFEERIKSEFEIVAPRTASLVCFRYRDETWTVEKENQFNELLLHTINETGIMFFTHTVLNGKFTLRMAICGTFTTQDHVENAISLITNKKNELLKEFK